MRVWRAAETLEGTTETVTVLPPRCQHYTFKVTVDQYTKVQNSVPADH